MPWVIAELRGKRVYARADARGELAADGGRVEIRYKPTDGRAYRAGVRNLEVVDATPLPDDTCAEADPVASSKGGKKAGAKRGSKKVDKTNAKPPPAPREGEIVAYTDGACSGNPGPAGLGVVVLAGAERIERFEYLGRATNNVAELTAIERALEEIGDREAIVYTDSQYAIGVLQKGWKAKANKELIAGIKVALAGCPKVRLAYVPGHAGIDLNERADELARRAVELGDKMRRVVPA